MLFITAEDGSTEVHYTYNHPSVSAGDWFKEPPMIPKSMDAIQNEVVKGIVSPPYPQMLTADTEGQLYA